MATYFGFAIADGMFPQRCNVRRQRLSSAEVVQRLEKGDVISCLNPSHKPTIDAAIKVFRLPISVPEKAPIVSLYPGDSVIVMSARGLPRLEGRHEYTDEEICQASFAFGEWIVGD